MSLIEGIRASSSLFGARGVWLVAKARLLRKPLEIVVSARGVPHPVHLRLRTSDVSVFSGILLKGEYDYHLSVAPRIIVDAGANIGMASLFFATKYPSAQIYAIEPEASNFRLLEKNSKPYKNIRPLQAALWGCDAELVINDPGAGNWGFQTAEPTALHEGSALARVPGISLDRLMAKYEIPYIDILKVDIEGAEKEVFENASRWIGRVGVILVEVHDHLKDGSRRAVYDSAGDFPHRSQRGETICFARERYQVKEPTEKHLADPVQCQILRSVVDCNKPAL